MSTNKELFYEKMDALASSITAKAGASGKKNLDELKILVQSITSGTSINGTTKQYKILTGETISAGDFVEYVNSTTTQANAASRMGVYTSCVLLEENKIFMAHAYGSNNNLMGSIITISGNTFTITTKALNTTSYSCSRGTSCVLLEANKVLIVHGYQSSYYYLYGTIVTISGTTMTAAASKMLNSTEKSCYTNPCAVLVGTNKVFIAHSYSSSYYLYGTIVTISGTTMTATSTQLSSTTNYAYRSPKCIYLGNNKLFLTFGYYLSGSNIQLYSAIVTISGTSMTLSSTSNIVTTSYSCYSDPDCVLVTTDGSNRHQVFISHSVGSTQRLYGSLVTINGTSMTLTQSLDLCGEDHSCYTNPPSCVLIDTGKILVVHPYTKYYKFYKTIVTVNGTTMTAETTKMNDDVYGLSWEASCVPIGNGKVFISHASDNSNYYLCGTIYMGECVKSYTNSTIGVAQTGGSGDQTINVYVPNG